LAGWAAATGAAAVNASAAAATARTKAERVGVIGMRVSFASTLEHSVSRVDRRGAAVGATTPTATL
jgi:hypothetical protein